MLEGNYN